MVGNWDVDAARREPCLFGGYAVVMKILYPLSRGLEYVNRL